ncbi:hypothetical protein WMF45_21635 [Sorangium sp. So ce448]|uniref:hypothetical protein n=1 Tax=Sorangium sp. So ce448 TaxID=3133314 RepID=UPI003F5F54EF
MASAAPPREGINAFLSVHGEEAGVAIDWDNPRVELVADEFPGVLFLRDCDLRPGGNRVRSFLDVVARDQVARAHVEGALDEFRRRLASAPLPLVEVIDGVGIRFSAEPSLEPERLDEYRLLRDRVVRLLQIWPETLADPSARSGP